MNSDYVYGLDFGTTNSVLSILDTESNEIVKTFSTPSLMYFPVNADYPAQCYIGHDAIDQYHLGNMQGRFIKSVKRILPRSTFNETKINSIRYTASDLVSIILKYLKNKADTFIGHECNRVILGRPVYFDDANLEKDNLAQLRLLRAAESAGFSEIIFQLEPIAAAFSYERTITKQELVFVADLGGGTTDFSVIQLDPQKRNTILNRRNDVLATGGIYIGGDSFDSSFMWEKITPHFGRGVYYESYGKQLELSNWIYRSICNWEQLSFLNTFSVKNELTKFHAFTRQNKKIQNLITLIDKNLGYSVFQSIEKSKVDLSSALVSEFKYSKLDIDISEQVSLTEYNNIIGEDVLKIKEYLDKFIVTNNVDISKIDSVFLTGGTSLVKSIQYLFFERFKGKSINTGDNFISISKGLAYSHYLLNNK